MENNRRYHEGLSELLPILPFSLFITFSFLRLFSVLPSSQKIERSISLLMMAKVKEDKRP